MAELGWLWHILLIMVVAFLLMAHGAPSNPAQGKMVLAEKVSQMMDWTKRNRVIRMSVSMFYHFVVEPPRNYSMIVMFTALHELRQCVKCKHAVEEFQILADYWQRYGTVTNKIFFAMVDYDESPEVFQMIQVLSVPNFLHFSVTRNFTSDDVYHWQERGITAEQMAKWVAERTNINIRIRQPTEDGGLFLLGTILALTGGLVYFLKQESIFNKTLWAILGLVFVTVMTSGQMWIHIKRAPYAQRFPHTGRIHYIHRMNHSQYAAETCIIVLLNMCISLGMVVIHTAATSRMGIVKRKMICMTGIGLVVTAFSWLLSLLRFKQRGYPYRFLMD